jgi:Kef-type K+ transport system membrane component KefB
MTLLFSIEAPHGTTLEFLVLFAVILFGPMVFNRLGMPGLIGLVIGGFLIGSHGLDLINSGNQTVPELGKLGLLYLMFVAGLELDLRVLEEYRRAAVILGLLAFAVPFSLGAAIGIALGWSVPAICLLGALVSSHTLITYPTIRDAGLDGNPAIASAVGATVLTDTFALIVLAIVAGTETGSGSIYRILLEIALGFLVLIVVGFFVLPRLVDLVLRQWASDRVARYIAILVALLFMAMLAEVFGIEPIVGAFFAGLALNRLVPNEGQSMERIEFFGTAVFVPVFLVSIGLLLDPSVMFTGHTLGLAALIVAAALTGKAIACWTAGSVMGFSRIERLGMYVLTIPQAAATLAVSLIGFEIGVFGTSVVNAVLVLILGSIVIAALLAQRVVAAMPAQLESEPLGSKVLVVTASGGPSDAAVRAATLLSRPDGGHSDVLIVHSVAERPPDRAELRSLEKRIFRHGFDGHVRTGVHTLSDAVAQSMHAAASLVIVDDPTYVGDAGPVPVLVLQSAETFRVIADGPERDGLAEEIRQRLARAEQSPIARLRKTAAPVPPG